MTKFSNIVFVGRVYVFRTADNGRTWSHTQTLVASDGVATNNFGLRISLNASVCAIMATSDVRGTREIVSS